MCLGVYPSFFILRDFSYGNSSYHHFLFRLTLTTSICSYFFMTFLQCAWQYHWRCIPNSSENGMQLSIHFLNISAMGPIPDPSPSLSEKYFKLSFISEFIDQRNQLTETNLELCQYWGIPELEYRYRSIWRNRCVHHPHRLIVFPLLLFEPLLCQRRRQPCLHHHIMNTKATLVATRRLFPNAFWIWFLNKTLLQSARPTRPRNLSYDTYFRLWDSAHSTQHWGKEPGFRNNRRLIFEYDFKPKSNDPYLSTDSEWSNCNHSMSLLTKLMNIPFPLVQNTIYVNSDSPKCAYDVFLYGP